MINVLRVQQGVEEGEEGPEATASITLVDERGQQLVVAIDPSQVDDVVRLLLGSYNSPHPGSGDVVGVSTTKRRLTNPDHLQDLAPEDDDGGDPPAFHGSWAPVE